MRSEFRTTKDMPLSHYRLFTAAIFCTAFGGAAQAAPVSVIPVPAQWQTANGTFKVDDQTVIVVPLHDAATRQSAVYFADLLARTRSLHLKIVDDGTAANAIVFAKDAGATVPHAEGYT